MSCQVIRLRSEMSSIACHLRYLMSKVQSGAACMATKLPSRIPAIVLVFNPLFPEESDHGEEIEEICCKGF
jgi:hypothetical protein